MSESITPRLFVLYSGEDIKLVQQLAVDLKNLDFNVVYQRNLIEDKSNWQKELDRELASADVVMILFTPNSISSENVLSELKAARVYWDQILLLPVVYNLETVPEVVSNINSIIWSDGEDYEDVIQEIARAVRNFMVKRESLRGCLNLFFKDTSFCFLCHHCCVAITLSANQW